MRIFITGSADGLGLMAAQLMIGDGHEVVLHARDAKRLDEAVAAAIGNHHAARDRVSGVVGDLSVRREVLAVAEQVNQLGPHGRRDP